MYIIVKIVTLHSNGVRISFLVSCTQHRTASGSTSVHQVQECVAIVDSDSL